MIARTVLALSLAASAPLVWGGVALATSDADPVVQERERAESDEEHGNPELAVFMKDLNSTLRGLGRGLKEEGAMANGLAEVLRLERAFVVAKEELPNTVTDIEDARERRTAELEWREQMNTMFKSMLDLEMAYARADEAEVTSQLRALNGLKKPGHDRFKKD